MGGTVFEPVPLSLTGNTAEKKEGFFDIIYEYSKYSIKVLIKSKKEVKLRAEVDAEYAE